MSIEVSVLIPTYNEERHVGQCLETILSQTHKSYEVIVVDDGSTDRTVEVVKKFIPRGIRFYQQNRGGPAAARNYGAMQAKGNILVFVDNDMFFSSDYVENLVKPIREGRCIGTNTYEEYVANMENRWAPIASILAGFPPHKHMPDLPPGHPEEGRTFRAIKKEVFLEVGGFDHIGFNDDESLGRKLKIRACTTRAVCYHYNPETLSDLYKTAFWWSRCDRCKKTFRSLLHYSLPNSIRHGIRKSLEIKSGNFLIAKIATDFAIFHGILLGLLTRRNRDILK